MSYHQLKNAEQFAVAPSFDSPAKLRITEMARTVEKWLVDGAADEELALMAESIHAEKLVIAGFIESSVPPDTSQSAQVEEKFLAGIACHDQACDALLLALGEGDQEACQSAFTLLDTGDRWLAEAEADLRHFQETCPSPESLPESLPAEPPTE